MLYLGLLIPILMARAYGQPPLCQAFPYNGEKTTFCGIGTTFTVFNLKSAGSQNFNDLSISWTAGPTSTVTLSSPDAGIVVHHSEESYYVVVPQKLSCVTTFRDTGSGVEWGVGCLT
jgi:hypothetical protein